MDKIKGLVAAPFAPMDGEGCVQLSAIAGYYRMLVKNGIVGAFVNGSTGEGASLSFDEKVKICEQWTLAAKAQPAFRIINLVGGTSYVECQELARISERLGCHAIAILAPYYFRPAGVEQLVDYIALIASVVPKMQVYFYHIPVLAGSNFPMIELLKRVNGKIPNFVGIKYTHEDFMDYLSCLNYDSRHYDLLWGRDENLLSALILGATGAVGSTYNYAAPLYHSLINAFNRGDFEEANRLQQLSINMIELLGKYGGIGAGKLYMRSIGFNCGKFRLPVRNIPDERFHEFEADVRRIGINSYFSVL